MNQPLKQSQLGMKASKMPNDKPNAGFESDNTSQKPLYKESDWKGTVKGKTKHTYKNGD